MKKSGMYFLKLFPVILQCAAIMMWLPPFPSPAGIDGKPEIVYSEDEGSEKGEPGIAPQEDCGFTHEISD